MPILVSMTGTKPVTDEELQSYVISLYENLRSVNTRTHQNVQQYLSELNGNSVIKDPDSTTGNWRTNIKSSLFFQKVIFAYLYLRSLIQKSTENLVSFDSPTSSYLPSAYKKIFDLAIYRTRYFDSIDKALYYSILSSVYALKIDVEYVSDEFGVEEQIVCEPIHPLLFYYTPDKSAFAVDSFIPYESAISLQKMVWSNKQVQITPYNSTDKREQTYYKTVSLSKKPVVKITHIFGRYIDSNFISLPYKFTVLNDRTVVDISLINHSDKRFPIVATNFYSEDMQLSYCDLLWDYYKEDSRFIRAIIDRALMATSMGFEVNTSVLDNQSKELVIKPFSVVYTVSDTQAIRPFNLASFDPNILPVRQLIVQESQNVSALTEFLMGLPTSRGRPTAKEVAIKTQMNQQIISTIVHRLENEFIKQTAQKLISLFIQYKLDECMELLNDKEREEFNKLINKSLVEGKEKHFYLVKELYKGINIRVEGLSGVLKQKDEVENLLTFVELASKLGITPYLDMVKIFESLFKKLELPSDLVRIPTQEELIAMAQQQAEKDKQTQQQFSEVSKKVLSDENLLEKIVKDPSVVREYVSMLGGEND